MKKYADNFRADKERWLFLTGGEKEIHKLLFEGFKVSAQRSANPTPGDEFDHSSRLAVVDKNGVIRAYYDGLRGKGPTAEKDFQENLHKLSARVQKLLQEDAGKN